MRRSSYLTGGLLTVFGSGCLVTAASFADEGPPGLGRSPLGLAIWGCVCVAWGVSLIVRTRADPGGA